MTGKKGRALAALLSHPNQREAARAAGISERTLYTFLRDPDFSREYRDALHSMLEESTRNAQFSLSPALKTLRSICEDTKAGSMARISAARSLLEYGLKLVEITDIVERLDALEEREDERKRG